MLRIAGLAAALGLSAFLPPAATAWTIEGHRVIADLAWVRLGPAAREEAARLLAVHPDYEEGLLRHLPAGGEERDLPRLLFREAAAWPDHARDYEASDPRRYARFHRGSWHYVNEVLWASEAAREELAGQVGPNRRTRPPRRARGDMNVVQAIAWQRSRLGDARAPDAERSLALSWLLHLVPDLHQPLHSVALFGLPALGAGGDRGGNLVCLSLPAWGENLHALWDRALVVGLEGEGTEALAASLAATPTAEPGAVLARASAEAWWRESVEIARVSVYPPWLRERAIEHVNGRPCGEPDAGRVALTPDYLATAPRVSRSRGALSALRLAILLEALLVD